MSLGDALFGVLQGMLLLNWPMTMVFVIAAWQRPHVTALTLMAAFSTVVATGITIYVWAVQNAAAGYPIPQDVSRVAFRLVLIGLAMIPIWFFYLFIRGKFHDDA